MAKLYFYYSAMNAGKTTTLLQSAYNYRERGMRVAILIGVAGGPALMPANHRYGDFPLPLVLHIVGAIVFVLAGIFQFLPRFRRRHPAWHRRAGRGQTHGWWRGALGTG